MKKPGILVLAGLVLACATTANAVLVKGEAEFKGVSTGLMNYVDYIYTDEGPILTTSGATFNFVHGNATTYDVDSSWHYYYQVENFLDVQIVAFSLNVDPNTILSAGWITGVDLDDVTTFDHNGVAGDHEAAWVAGPTDPKSAVFSAGGLAPNVSYDFDKTSGFELTMNEFSTVLFVSCDQPPIFKFSAMQNGESFNGKLPVPQNPVPEPMSMILIAASALGLYIRKRINN